MLAQCWPVELSDKKSMNRLPMLYTIIIVKILSFKRVGTTYNFEDLICNRGLTGFIIG